MKAKVHVRKILFGNREEERFTLALCDEELLGKVFEQGEAVLDLEKYRRFYEGEKVSEEQAVELLRAHKNINVVGKKSIAAARKALKIELKNVKRIAGVPHLQIYCV